MGGKDVLSSPANINLIVEKVHPARIVFFIIKLWFSIA